MVYLLVFFSVVDKIGWYINRISLLWTILVVISIISVMDSNGLYISLFFLSWTKLVGISTGLVCCGQYWLLYQPVLSVMDNIGW